MENIETLLAAVAQTQGFDDDEPAASTPSELGLENSASAAATQLVAGVSAEVRPSPAVGQVIGGGEKRKRGRPPKAHLGANPPPPKRNKVEDEDEDVCFICFDGGSLVLCDRKGCPKAYHPACIKRDEAFFQTKSKWNCGWHICSVCRKASYFMCYTCSYSLCKACIKKEDFLCVRGNKGFCSTCIKPIMLIENKDQTTNDSIKVDFDDKLSWEYLFKMYWLPLKEKLSLTLSELTQAKNPWKVVATEACKPQFNAVLPTADGGEVSVSYRSTEPLEQNKPHVDINFLQIDGLRSSSNGNHVEKLHSDKEENMSSYNKDTLKPNTDKATDQTSTNKAIEKDLDDSSIVKDTNMPCISKNANTRELDKPAIDREWASKDLLEFVAHMKNGDTSAISQFDVQTLLLDYIKRNNLRDPRRKSQIICDQRLKNIFGKPRVGHIEMLKLLEFHFLLKEDSHNNSFIPAGFVSSVANDAESDGKMFGLAAPVNIRKRKTRKRSKDRAPPPQHDSNEYAAIDVHNISLIYLRRNLMENLLDDRENCNNKVIGSIVRIRISTNDQKPEVHRLVQVVGTSKVAEPYKIGNRTAEVMLEVLNLDKKEVVSIDGISNQEFTEEECRRLRQSIRCGLVKHFTVGEVQKKVVALQSVRVNDWLEAEVSRLNHLRDRASEKGHKKELREYVDRLLLLKSPEERTRRISEVPEIHADPKMNPNYESEEDNRSGGDGKKDECVRPSYSQFPRNGRKTSSNKKGKEERSTKVKNRVIEKTNANGSSSSDKHMNQIDIGISPNDGRNDQAVQRSGLETSTATACTTNSPSADNIETEKLWHYRDPNGKIQGPFSMMQLRKWSTTGLFPPDMRIWTNHEQYDSLLLTDALSGKLHAASDLSHARRSSDLHENKPSEGVDVKECTNGISRHTEANVVMKVDESGSSGWPQCWDLLKNSYLSIDDVKARDLTPPSSSGTRDAALSDRCQGGDDLNRGSLTGENNSMSGCELQTKFDNEDRAGKPSEENLRSLNIDLGSNNIESGSVSADVLEPPESSKRAEDVDILDLPSPTLKAETESSVSADIHAQKSGVLELLSPPPRLNNENEEAQATETKQSGFTNLHVSNSGPGWNGSAQLPEVADEWCGYSPTPARPSIQEWDPGLISASPSKPPEVKIEIIDTSASDSHQVTHDSLSYPTSNMPNWLSIMNEPIEFVALGEDSVSDLLAEVDAMESQGVLPSPTSAIKFARELLEDSKDDCFSSIEDFSSAPEPRRSDALSSTSNVHLTSRLSEPSRPNGSSPVDAFDFFHRSSVNSSASSEGETNAQVHYSDAGSGNYPPPSSNVNQDIIGSTMAPGMGSDGPDASWGGTMQGNINLVTVQGNVNLVLGGSGQGMANLGWGSSPGPAWANPSTNRSPRNGSLPWDGQRKYGGERFNSPREWGYQGGEAGFGRGRQPWGRQPYSGGGGYSRPLPKGQRVCKFYEGGHCKKGAFCDYLHP